MQEQAVRQRDAGISPHSAGLGMIQLSAAMTRTGSHLGLAKLSGPNADLMPTIWEPCGEKPMWTGRMAGLYCGSTQGAGQMAP